MERDNQLGRNNWEINGDKNFSLVKRMRGTAETILIRAEDSLDPGTVRSWVMHVAALSEQTQLAYYQYWENIFMCTDLFLLQQKWDSRQELTAPETQRLNSYRDQISGGQNRELGEVAEYLGESNKTGEYQTFIDMVSAWTMDKIGNEESEISAQIQLGVWRAKDNLMYLLLSHSRLVASQEPTNLDLAIKDLCPELKKQDEMRRMAEILKEVQHNVVHLPGWQGAFLETAITYLHLDEEQQNLYRMYWQEMAKLLDLAWAKREKGNDGLDKGTQAYRIWVNFQKQPGDEIKKAEEAASEQLNDLNYRNLPQIMENIMVLRFQTAYPGETGRQQGIKRARADAERLLRMVNKHET